MNTQIKAQHIPFVFDFDPGFDYEIAMPDYVPNLEGGNRLVRQPLTVGGEVPSFELAKANGVWRQASGHLSGADTVTLGELIGQRPLVISFYAPEWGDYGAQHLEALARASRKISGLGGHLLILTSVSADEILTLSQENGLSFSLFHDEENRVAEAFGVFSKAYPIWQWVAGVDADVPFAGTFVIDQNGTINHAFTSRNLDAFFDTRDVLTAVYAAKDVRQSA